MIGLINGCRNWPEYGTWSIGLMLIDPVQRGKGVGLKAFSEFHKNIRLKKAKRIELVVQKNNLQALKFWKKAGFAILGEKKEITSGTPVWHLGLEVSI